ncbi:MAG: hypothetical protein H7A24_12550 [Leptospiraceae bacterium]|nr:hypothetical protein [Leptospiraceae bacterium]
MTIGLTQTYTRTTTIRVISKQSTVDFHPEVTQMGATTEKHSNYRV